MNEQEFAELAAGHALHALSPDDESRYREALAEHPEWEGVALVDAAVAASLAEGVGRVAPPLTMRSTLLARIGSLPQVPPVAGAAGSGAGVSGALRRDRSGRAGDGDEPAGDDDVAEPVEAETEAEAVEAEAEAEAVEAESEAVEGETEAVEAETEVVEIDSEAVEAVEAERDPTDPLIVLLGTVPDATDDTAESATATTELPVEPADAAVPIETELPDDAPPSAAAEPVPTTTAMQAVARRNWTRGLLALAACLTLLVGVGFGAGALYNWMNRPAAVVALDEIESAPDAQSATVVEEEGLTATVHWSEQLGKVVLVSDGLPSIPEDETFELWFVRGDEAISAGTFAPDGSAATTALEGEMQPGDVIAVTVEPAGGAPDGTPTSDPIVAVPTA